MRLLALGLGAVLLAAASPAQATRYLILTDPMSLERRLVVIEDKGPDRYFMCGLPPVSVGCREIMPRRR